MRRYQELIKEKAGIEDQLKYLDADGNLVVNITEARSSEGVDGLFWFYEVPEMREQDILDCYNWLTRMLMVDELPRPDDPKNKEL